MKKIAIALATLACTLAAPAIATADNGYPSESQVHSARYNTLIRTAQKCHSEQLVDDRGVIQAMCWKPQVLFCFRHRKPRSVYCYAMFHRVWVDRFHHGRVDTFTKMFQWRVLRPVFGFLFAREKPKNPWVYGPGI